MSLLATPQEPGTEALSLAFEAAFSPDGLAANLGFGGFTDADVVDLNSAYGEYAQIARNLGARSLTCIGRNLKETAYSLDIEAIKPVQTVMQSYGVLNDDRFENGFDIATIYNIPSDHVKRLLLTTRQIIKPDGQLVITTVECGLLSRTRVIERLLKPYFDKVDSSKVWFSQQPQIAHNIITVASGKHGPGETT